MAKQAIALRLAPETLAWLDGYAKVRGASRQVVLEAAVESFRRGCEGGVPDVPVVDTPEVRAKRATPGGDVAAWNAARQRKLNEAKYGRAS